MSVPLAPGEVLGGRFEVRAEAVWASMVFLHAHDQLLDRAARVWLLTPQEHVERTAEVARTLASVQHPCLSALHVVAEAETSAGPAVLVAYRGHQGYALRQAHGGRPADAATTVEVIDQVASGLAAVHAADQSLGCLDAEQVVLDADGCAYILDPLVAAVGHNGPAGAGPVHQQRDLGALVGLVIELLTGEPVPSDRRDPRTLPRLATARPVLADLDRVLAEAVRPDRPPPRPTELADRVRDALVAVL